MVETVSRHENNMVHSWTLGYFKFKVGINQQTLISLRLRMWDFVGFDWESSRPSALTAIHIMVNTLTVG